MIEFKYKLNTGDLIEVDTVITAYEMVGWKTKEIVLPTEGFPTHIIFIWNNDGPPIHPPIRI